MEYFKQPGRKLLRDPARPLQVSTQAVLCFTNRCGSNWLAELLHSTGLIGLADEFFNAERIQETCDRRELTSLDDFIRFLPQIHSTQNDAFITKLSWDQLYFLTRIKAIPGIIKNPKFLYMKRRDMAAQALSFLIAQQTGQWKSTWNSGVHGTPNPSSITDAQIRATIDQFMIAHRQFQKYFDSFGITPHVVYYEDLQQNPRIEIDKILTYLDIQSPQDWTIDTSKLQLKKQADTQTTERLARFHCEYS